MSESAWREELGIRIRSSQIVVSALVVGAIVFLTVASVLVLKEAFEPVDGVMLFVMNLTLILFLIGDMIARMIVPGLTVARERRKIVAGEWAPPEGPGQNETTAFLEQTGDAGRLMCVYQMKTIIASALLEGVCFFAIIVFMRTQSMIGLAIAIIMIVGLVFHIPSRSGVIHWIEDQLVLIEQERSLNSA
jgi:hypothetical protein